MRMGTEFWVAHVAKAKLEVLPASEYARRHEISVAALYYWQRKLKAANDTPQAGLKRAKPSRASKFVALRVVDSAAERACRCTLVLASGMRLEISALPSPEWVTALARATPVAQEAR